MQFEISIALNFLIAYLYNKLPRRRVNMLGEQMLEYLRLKFQDHWYPDRPAKGSAYRSIRISKEKVDKILVNAAIDIGLDLQEILETLPNDLTIWIDPGEVSYRIGEKGLVEFLYEDEKRHLIRNSESSSDSEEVSHHNKTFSTSSIEPINYDTEEFQSLDSLTISDFSSWTNSISTPVLSAQTFAQTKFGSLKNKTIGRKHQTKILPNEFSAYIKQKEQIHFARL